MRRQRSMKMAWKLFGTIIVVSIGYAVGRIGDRDYIKHPSMPDRAPAMNTDEYTIIQGTSPFVSRKLKDFEVAPLHWASNGKQVDENARLVGLPQRLTDEIQKFCIEIGLIDVFQWAAQSGSLGIGDTIITGPDDLKDGHKWAITRDGEDTTSSNLHLLEIIDESNFEATVDVLRRGDFDYVLNTIAADFKPWGYMFAGLSFTIATHSEASLIHQRNPDAGKDSLNLIFPIHLPEENIAKMYVGNYEEKKAAPLDLRFHQGLLLGGDTAYGMADFDYQKDGNFHIFASISIANIHEDNVDIIADEYTALLPMSGTADWLLAQRGRFWGGASGGSFELDRGRRPYQPEDELENCPDLAELGLCLKPSESKDDPGLWDVRKFCARSCGIFIDDETYFSKVRPPRGQKTRES